MTREDARKLLAGIALNEVGNREAGGNNRGPVVEKYQRATWLAPDAWPWCAAFVCWCVREWLRDSAVRDVLGVSDAEAWRPKTAGAFDYANWARKQGLAILPEQAAIEAGDIVIFDFSHIGIVVEDAPAGSATIETVEGNTNGRGDRESTTGDGVWRKRRQRSLAKQFVRVC